MAWKLECVQCEYTDYEEEFEDGKCPRCGCLSQRAIHV